MKITKTKVLTVLLIIAVVIIAILSVKLLSKEENNTVNQPQEVVVNSEQIEEKKEEPAVEENKIKGEKLLQFDTEFYNLEDVALEWRDSEKVKNYKDFNYDLDGDGVVDKVTMKWDKEENGELILSLNGVEFDRNFHYPYVYIVDLNENDKSVEVVTWDLGPSDDPNYNVYSKINGKMEVYNITLGWELKLDKNGKVVVENPHNAAINPKIYFDYIFTKDGKIENKGLETTDELKKIELKFNGNGTGFSTDIDNFDKFWEYEYLGDEPRETLLDDFNIEFMTEDKSFKILDLSSKYVELSDGRKGYIQYMQFAG